MEFQIGEARSGRLTNPVNELVHSLRGHGRGVLGAGGGSLRVKPDDVRLARRQRQDASSTTADEERGMRLLPGFGLEVQPFHPVVVTRECHRFLPEHQLDEGDRFLKPGDADRGRIERQASRDVVGAEPATPNAKLQATIGQEVDRRGFLGEDDRMAEVVGQHGTRDPQAAGGIGNAIIDATGPIPPRLRCSPNTKRRVPQRFHLPGMVDQVRASLDGDHAGTETKRFDRCHRRRLLRDVLADTGHGQVQRVASARQLREIVPMGPCPIIVGRRGAMSSAGIASLFTVARDSSGSSISDPAGCGCSRRPNGRFRRAACASCGPCRGNRWPGSRRAGPRRCRGPPGCRGWDRSRSACR